MRKKVVLPKFSSEAEEAEWWDSHHTLVEDSLLEAIAKGETEQSMARKLTRKAQGTEKKSPV